MKNNLRGPLFVVTVYVFIAAITFFIYNEDSSSESTVTSRVQGQISGVIDADDGKLPKSEEVVKANARNSGFDPEVYYAAYVKGYGEERKHPMNKSER